MMKNKWLRISLVLIALLWFSLTTPIASASRESSLVGQRFECMYKIVDGERRLIVNPEERPYVEFLSNQKCEYLDGGDNSTYVEQNNRIMIVEGGAIPMLAFTSVSSIRLRLEGYGLMYYSYEEYDEFFYNVTSDDYISLNEQAKTLREYDAKNTSMGKLERINRLIPFRNGYACVADEDNNYHYIDTSGNIVMSVDNKYISSYYWPIDNGVTLIHADDGIYQMVDLQNNVIKEFSASDYSRVGAPSEGYVCAEKINRTLSGTSYSTVYYDNFGQEQLTFDNLCMLTNGLSNFSNGRAFLKKENEAGSSDDEYILVDTFGNAQILGMDDTAALMAAIKGHYLHAHEEYNARITPDSWEIKSVHAFEKGEKYAAAIISIKYSVNETNSFGREYSYKDDVEYLACITLDGKVTLICEAYSCSPCINNSIIFSKNSSSNSIYNITEDQILDVSQIASLHDAKNHKVSFIDNGQFLVSMNSGDFHAVIERNGKVISEPIYNPDFFFNSADMLGNSEEPYASDCSLRYEINTKPFTRILSSSLIAGHVKNRNSNTPSFEYVDITGTRVAGGPYVMGLNFVNGYTLVGSSISESKKYSRSPLTKNLYFINTEGEHVDHIELPSSKKNSDQPIQPFTIKPVLIDEASVITLSNQSAAAEENEENIEDSSAAKADIPSAFYEVTGFQPMKIAIATDDNGTILGVRVIEHGETPGFGADLIDHAPTFEKLVGQSIFTAQIDIRSGATLTSRAINEALRLAAVDSNICTSSSQDTDPLSSAPIYEVTGFQPMKIAIATDDNGTILGVRVIEHGETPGFGADLIDHAPTFEKLVDQSIFTAQIDIRSGATLTSRAINEALKQAAAN